MHAMAGSPRVPVNQMPRPYCLARTVWHAAETALGPCCMLAIVAFRWRERGDAASKGESERGTHGATPTSGCQRLDQRAAQQVGTLLVPMLTLNPNAPGKNGSGAVIRGFRICGFWVRILFCIREFADSDTRKSSGFGRIVNTTHGCKTMSQ